MSNINCSGVTGYGPGWTGVVTEDGRRLKIKGIRATRNNNPGNVRYGEFAQRHGALGTDGEFAVFGSRDARFEAMAALIFGPSYADRSLQQAIAKYAPPKENDSLAYAMAVSKAADIPLGTKVKHIPPAARRLIVDAMSRMEGLGTAKAYDEEGAHVWTLDPRYDNTTADGPRPSPRDLSPAEQAYADHGRSRAAGPGIAAYGDLARSLGEAGVRGLDRRGGPKPQPSGIMDWLDWVAPRGRR